MDYKILTNRIYNYLHKLGHNVISVKIDTTSYFKPNKREDLDGFYIDIVEYGKFHLVYFKHNTPYKDIKHKIIEYFNCLNKKYENTI